MDMCVVLAFFDVFFLLIIRSSLKTSDGPRLRLCDGCAKRGRLSLCSTIVSGASRFLELLSLCVWVHSSAVVSLGMSCTPSTFDLSEVRVPTEFKHITKWRKRN